MKYLVMLNTNSDFRYVPIKEFINYIETRYTAHREECEARNHTLFQQQQHQSQGRPSAGHGTNLHLQRAAKEVEDSVENLAKQARMYAEELGPLTNV